MELATDADKAAEFVNGIIPSDLAKQIQLPKNPEDVAKMLASSK